MKLTKALFRLAYKYSNGIDMLCANEDYDQYLRTGEIPKYLQDFLRKEREGEWR